MGTPLRVLIVEDREDDALLIVNELKRGEYEPLFERVDTREGMDAALKKDGWEIVLSDYALPQFNAAEALRLLQKSGRDLPFIVISGMISEDVAVSMMKMGAHDCLVKNNLARLVPAVKRELEEVAIRTDRRRAHSAIVESERRYRATVDSLEEAIYVIDRSMRIILVNRMFMEWCKRESLETDLIEKDLFEIVTFLPESVRSQYEEMARTGKEQSSEETMVIKEKTYVCDVRKMPIVEAGQVTRIVTVIRDITAHKHAEARLVKLNECFLGFTEDPDENIMNLTRVCGEVMNATTALYNRLDSDMLCSIGQWKTPADFKANDKAEGHICYDVIRQKKEGVYVVRNLLDTPYARTDPNVVRYGLKTYIGTPVRSGGVAVGSLCVVYQKDFVPDDHDKKFIEIIASAIGTEEGRKDVQEKLRKAKDFLDGIINAISDPIFVKDEKHRMLMVNDAEVALTGHPKEKVIGKTDYEFFPEGQVDVFWGKDDIVLKTGTVKENEELITDATGKTHVILTKKSRYKDPVTGERVLVGVIRDITERKATEEELRRAYEQLKETQVQLIQMEKMQVVGTMASGIAHEVKNPLAVIVLAANYLEDEIDRRNAKAMEAFAAIKAAVGRANMIVRGLLDFSRQSSLRFAQLDIHRTVESALGLIEKQMALKGIEIIKDFKGVPSLVSADENHMEQAFMNIVLNSIQAMPGGGRLYLRTYNKDAEELARGLRTKDEGFFKVGGQAVIIEIEDTGCGIPEDVLSRIFDPFFTTKPPGQGVGLGMSVTRTIIDRHKGLIRVESKVGKGTKVTVALPVIKGQGAPEKIERRA